MVLNKLKAYIVWNIINLLICNIMLYLVIIGDIIGSKKIEDRYTVQKHFADVLREPQVMYGETFVSPLTLTIGDEFQAVMSNSDSLFSVMSHIENKMGVVSLRYGIGIGEINTEINYKNAIGMDGAAFHFAREAVETARREKRQYHFDCQNEKIQLRINTLFDWIDISKRRWNDQRKKILYYHQKKMTQKEIAEKLGMTQPAVSQNINDITLQLINKTQSLIQDEINEILTGKSC